MEHFKATVEAIEGKKAETAAIMEEIQKATRNIGKVKIGKEQASLGQKLCVLKSECERNRTTSEELDFYTQFVAQVALTHQTAEHLDELLKGHSGISKHDINEALQNNKVDIEAYRGGSIVGSQCMTMAKNGDKIMDAITASIRRKVG